MPSVKNVKNGFAGLGRKHPQLDVPIDLLELDSENPRLAKEGQGTQFDLQSKLYTEFDLEELAYSMAENGYFDEEPIVVIPKKLPKAFQLSDNTEKQQKDLQDLIQRKEIKLIVVEGNRRVATAQILTDSDLSKRLKIPPDFPKPASREIAKDLEIIPAIFYPNRTGISAYLGVRHIAGLLKWEIWAKTVYVASRIEEGIKARKTVEQSIKEVQRQTADRSDVIKKQYLCYKVAKTAEEDLGFDINRIKNRFSLITVALNSPSIRGFIGVKSYKEVDFSKRIVPIKRLDNLGRLLTWIYGDNGSQPILTDSRKITSTLSPVLADEDATEYLLKNENLEDAYERSGGERAFLLKKINGATRNLRNALGVAYKYKTKDVLEAVDDCIKAADELRKMVGQ